MTQFIIVRHGETKLNANEDRIRSWRDVPLDAEGKKQAVVVSKAIKHMAPQGIITSDLDRSEDTAKIISEHTGIPIVGTSFTLRPWNEGEFTGRPTAEVIDEIHRYVTETPDKTIPGGESWNAFVTRLLTATLLFAEAFEKQKIVMVSHHRCERVLCGWQKKGQPYSFDLDLKTVLQKGIPTGAHWTLTV